MLIDDLKSVASLFCELTGKSRSAISVAIYGPGDRNRFKRVFDGFDIKTADHDSSMQWFSDNWPDGAEWPVDVVRPDVSAKQEQSA